MTVKLPPSIRLYIEIKNQKIGYTFPIGKYNPLTIRPYLKAGILKIKYPRQYELVKEATPQTENAKIYEHLQKNPDATNWEVAKHTKCHKNYVYHVRRDTRDP